jgi:preprotein translocase subunit SecB
MSEQQANNLEFNINHLYVLDVSCEVIKPMHKLAKWQPDAKISRECSHKLVDENEYEVVLKVKVDVTSDNTQALIVEIQQAGSFLLKNFTEKQIEHLLESYCPSILLPYARQALSAQVIQAGFPPLFLPPVDFESEFLNKKSADKVS